MVPSLERARCAARFAGPATSAPAFTTTLCKLEANCDRAKFKQKTV